MSNEERTPLQSREAPKTTRVKVSYFVFAENLDPPKKMGPQNAMGKRESERAITYFHLRTTIKSGEAK